MSATSQSSPPSKAAGRTEATPKPAMPRKSGAGRASGARKAAPAAGAGTDQGQAKTKRKKKLQAAPADERRRMIAEAAYFRAERRGFAEGGQVEDWLKAEAEIDGKS